MIEFEWDSKKEISNFEKHKVTFLDAIESFSDPIGFLLEDGRHSFDEIRYFWVGKSRDGRVLTTWFTKRDQVIRIIGSGQWRKFRRLYEATKIE